MNTLFLIPGEVGGSQTYFCETFQALLEAGHPDTYVLFTQQENDAYLRVRYGGHARVAFVRFAFSARNRCLRILLEQTVFPLRARRERLDVLWSPGYTAPILLGSVPQVVSILDMQYQSFPQDLSWLARLVTHGLLWAAVRKRMTVLTLSAFSKQEIIRYLAAPPERIHITPLAAHRSFAHPSGVDAYAYLPFSKGCPYLLCVANTYPHKNVHTLVHAFGKIAACYPHGLVLVGKPRRGEPEVSAALGQIDYHARVVRIDTVEHESLVALYQSCSAFVFPSLYEGFGLPVLEAMLAGVPVVTADTAIAAEVGGEWAHRCDARDPGALAKAIRAALGEEPAARQRRLDGARAHAARCTWEATAATTRAALAAAR